MNDEVTRLLHDILGLPTSSISTVVAGLVTSPNDYTKKGQMVLVALDSLETAKLRDNRAQIIYWAGALTKAAADLAAEYLREEAKDLLEVQK